MAWHAVISALTSFGFYQDSDKPRGVGFLVTLKKPIYLKIILIRRVTGGEGERGEGLP